MFDIFNPNPNKRTTRKDGKKSIHQTRDIFVNGTDEEYENQISFPIPPQTKERGEKSLADKLYDHVESRHSLDNFVASSNDPVPPRTKSIADILFGSSHPPVPARKPSAEPEQRTPADILYGQARETPLPVPKRKPPILSDKVEDETIRKEVEGHERSVQHMYKDTSTLREGGFVTVGAGFKINNAEEAKQYPFTVPDGQGGRRPATDEEIEQAFHKVDAIKQPSDLGRGLTAGKFKPSVDEFAKKHNLDDLQLSKDAINDILDKKLREHANILSRKMNNDGVDFVLVPPSAQKLLLDLQYNGALGNTDHRKGIVDAIRARDWTTLKGVLAQDKYKIGESRDAWRLKQADEALEWDAKQGQP